MSTSLRDLRTRMRTLLVSPLLTCIVVITVALGIGARSGLSRVVNAVLLRPLELSYVDRFSVPSRIEGESESSKSIIESELKDDSERSGFVVRGASVFSVAVPVWVSVDDICLETLCRNRTLRFKIAPQQ